MTTRISIPTALRQYAGNNNVVSINASTVGNALTALTEQYPDLGKHLFADGKLRSFVNVYVNEDDIRYLNGLTTTLWIISFQMMRFGAIAGT